MRHMRARLALLMVCGAVLFGLTSMTANAAPMAAPPEAVAPAATPGTNPDGTRFKYTDWKTYKGGEPGIEGEGAVDIPGIDLNWQWECSVAARWYVEELGPGNGTHVNAPGSPSNTDGKWSIQFKSGKCKGIGGTLTGKYDEVLARVSVTGTRVAAGEPETPGCSMLGSGPGVDQTGFTHDSVAFEAETDLYRAPCHAKSVLFTFKHKDDGEWKNTTFDSFLISDWKFPPPPDIAEAAPPTGVCQWGVPVAAKITNTGMSGNGYNYSFGVTFGSPLGNRAWSIGIVFRNEVNGATGILYRASFVLNNAAGMQTNTGTQIPIEWKAVGVHVWGNGGGSQSSNPGPTVDYFNPNFPTGSGSRPGFAQNLPESCSFYFGQKLYDDGQPGGKDEPHAPADGNAVVPPDQHDPNDAAPPAPVEPPDPFSECDFSITDPTSWVGGGICYLVGLLSHMLLLLRSVVAAIVGLPKALVAALIAAVAALFVVDKVFLSEKKDELQEDFQEGGAGDAMDNLTEIAGQDGSGGGCEGPALDLEFIGQVFHPMQSCSGVGATVKTASHAALTATAWFGAGLGSVRLFLSAWGLQTGLGRKDDD